MGRSRFFSGPATRGGGVVLGGGRGGKLKVQEEVRGQPGPEGGRTHTRVSEKHVSSETT